MNNKLAERCRLAIHAYERAVAVVAQRSGAVATMTEAGDQALLELAGRLAMPPLADQQVQALPALQALAGHLLGETKQGYYCPQLLDATQSSILPQTTRPTDLAAQYRTIWPVLQAELTDLPGSATPPVREAGFLGLLQRYIWAMAAPGEADTDVSLYDYTRVQAALAVCRAEQPAESTNIALLIGGDVSGVQDWLYTIGSEGAARSLRGRSVYLQLLSEIIAQWLLDNLELPSCNLLYAGGGNFYILAPLSAADQLDDLQIKLTQNLLKMHDGALYVALGHAVVTRTDLEQAQMGEAWGQVNAAMSLRKRRRFAELTDDAEMAQAIGSALAGTGKLTDSCRVCRRPISEGEKAEANDEDERVCQLCGSFEELGNQLRHADFLVVSRLPTAAQPMAVMDWNAGLRQFGYDVQVVRYGHAWREPASDLVRIYFWQHNRPALSDFPGNPNPNTTVWLYRPLARATPIHDGKVATFDQLQSEGIQRWGVLRMDVDKLGHIFQQGVQPASLSRVVGLSGMLRLFFEGYVPQLADDFNAKGPRIYLMYAGGDDLFVVGGWSHLPELAWDIREALRKFAAGNDKITISAGISLALSKSYPIYQAAQDAGEAEEMAKREGRNRIAFLGQAVEWEGDNPTNFQSVRRRVQQIVDWLTGHDLNRAFLMRLREIDAEMRVWQKDESVVAHARYTHDMSKRLFLGPWLWHMVYSLRRATEKIKDGEARSSVSHFIENIVPQEIEVLGLESRWAEFLTRKEDGDK